MRAFRVKQFLQTRTERRSRKGIELRTRWERERREMKNRTKKIAYRENELKENVKTNEK